MRHENEAKLAEVFRAALSLGPETDVMAARQLNTPAWDSLAHVTLVAAVESEFGVSVDTAESLGLTSFAAVRLFLEERGA